MKNTDYVKSLRGKTGPELKAELAALRREQFSLRMQAGTGQLVKNNLVGQARRKIARVKTLMRQQAKA
ncbi:MAG TPA: 50S ribosomal protein L29 [Nevskiaceae bacterium]|nr:50S ribosomal protein L29 [Nevskiaceae bacterium]